MGVALGLLDVSELHGGQMPAQALAATRRLAVMGDELGYSRYWVGEHPGTNAAHASPELLVAVLAEITRRIKVGSAGVLLSLRSPLRVAQDFRVLETLFPDRIDLGLARGLAPPGPTADELLGASADMLTPELYADKVRRLVRYLRGTGPVETTPSTGPVPEIWLLGSSSGSVELAAEQGVSYSHSLFHQKSDADPRVLEAYRTSSGSGAKPNAHRCNVAVAGVCAQTDQRAKRLREAYENPFFVSSVVGEPARCAEEIEGLRTRYRVDEVVFLDMCVEPEDKLRSIELLASACF